MENYIRAFAGASLAVLMLGLGAYNVNQWLSEGFYILAVVAICAELIGFVMAVMVEIAIRAKRWLASAVCGLILIVCAGFNVIGAERAWDASMARHLEGARLEAQAALDIERGELRQKLADANRQIGAYDYLLPGAETFRARQAGMQAAWERATAQARNDALMAQRGLDRLPVVAEVAAPFQAWQVQVGFALAELIKALGLWAIGMGGLMLVAETQRRQGNVSQQTETANALTAETTPETLTRTGNVISMKQRAIDLRGMNLSYSKIGAEIGCSKKHAWMLVNT